jgi:hypothetical protein
VLTDAWTSDGERDGVIREVVCDEKSELAYLRVGHRIGRLVPGWHERTKCGTRDWRTWSTGRFNVCSNQRGRLIDLR